VEEDEEDEKKDDIVDHALVDRELTLQKEKESRSSWIWNN
jgi:hypothetical protein